jgi:hypothetical protein
MDLKNEWRKENSLTIRHATITCTYINFSLIEVWTSFNFVLSSLQNIYVMNAY